MNKDTIKQALEAIRNKTGESEIYNLAYDALELLSTEQQEEAQPCELGDACLCVRESGCASESCQHYTDAAPSSAAPDQPQAEGQEEAQLIESMMEKCPWARQIEARNAYRCGWRDRAAAPSVETVQPASKPTEPEIVWWEHTMDNTEGIDGNEPKVVVTRTKENPFGRPGKDYSASFPVTSVALTRCATSKEATSNTMTGFQIEDCCDEDD